MKDVDKDNLIPGVPRHAGKGVRFAPALALTVLLACVVFSCMLSFQAGNGESGGAQSLREKLNDAGLPTIYIYTRGGKSPTFVENDPPEGAYGRTIKDNAYINGYCEITNLSSGRAFTSRMKVKARGNTTARAAGVEGKMPYKLVLKDAVDLFENGHVESRYALLATQGQDLRTHLSFLIGQQCGMKWTPDCRFVNVVLNDDYRGVYLLVSAVDGASLSEHVGPQGFMIECDAYWWNESVYFEAVAIGPKKYYTVKYPDGERLTDARLQQIKEYMDALGNDIKKDGASDRIDMETFIAWLMTRDITGEIDAAGANIYYYLEKFDAGDPERFKLHMGPLWDFDNTFRRDGVCDGKWSPQRENRGLYFRYLLKNEAFIAGYGDCWNRVYPSLIDVARSGLQALIEAEGRSINASRRLDAERWGSSMVPIEDEAEEKIDWLKDRMAWIDSQLAGEDANGETA